MTGDGRCFMVSIFLEFFYRISVDILNTNILEGAFDLHGNRVWEYEFNFPTERTQFDPIVIIKLQ